MAKTNKFFMKRGEQDVVINLYDEDIKIKIIILTNKQHDTLMEQFTEITPEGTGDIRMADFVEEQMIQCLIELPFEVPIDEEMTKFIDWKNANSDERKIAISLMDSKLRDAITNRINGVTKVSQKEAGN